jgi:hypothetical protein
VSSRFYNAHAAMNAAVWLEFEEGDGATVAAARVVLGMFEDPDAGTIGGFCHDFAMMPAALQC